MTMKIERKFIDLKDLTVTDEGPGRISGYRAVFSEIDEGGDLIVPGFFKDSLAEYLEAGFTAHSHDWDYDKLVGYPVDAKEDDHGLFVDSEFHSTPDAQAIRVKSIERQKAGKRVGFSFGYSVSDKSFIEAKDYKEQLPQFIKPERLQANLLKAQKFDRIRILKQGAIMEDSIVTAPMNRLAQAASVKSVTDAVTELTDEQIQQILASADDEFYLKAIAASESFESFDKAASAALKKFIDNMQRNHEARVKEGRVLSTSNRTLVQQCRDGMVVLIEELNALLAMSEPTPKEKQADALRTQWLRLEGESIAALSR